MASTLDTLSVRDMLEALIAGERDPRRLADLARGRMKTKRAALIEALTGRFDDHHGELARMLLDQIDALSGQINTLTIRIDQLLATTANDVPGHDDGDSGAGGQPSADLTVVQRLTEIPGIGPTGAQVILAESGTIAALLRRSPLRTVRATRRGTRLKQAARASRGAVLAACVCELEARGSRRCVSGGFYCPQPISLLLVGEIVGSEGPADDVQPPVFPLPWGLRWLVCGEQTASAERTVGLLPGEQAQVVAVQRGFDPSPPSRPVVDQVRVVRGRRTRDQLVPDDVGPGELDQVRDVARSSIPARFPNTQLSPLNLSNLPK